MKHLLIVYHSQSGTTKCMAEACYAGAIDPQAGDVQVRLCLALEASAADLLWADGLLIGTPENFGYMSGGLKDFLDRVFYAVEGKVALLPYGIFISAGNDGTGAVTAIQRICNGFPFKQIQPELIVKNHATPGTLPTAEPVLSEAATAKCRELGLTLAAGLDAGIF